MQKNTLLQGMRAADNFTRTENMAITHRSTLNDVLDFFYHAPARRGKDNTQLFSKAYAEDALLAIKALFYVRDIRGGGHVGERETFRQGLRYLHTYHRAVFNRLITLIPIYGRWDDILEFVDNPEVVEYVHYTLKNDLDTTFASDNESITQLAKWMPSSNTSSKNTRALARRWMQALHVTEAQYRRTLSRLRERIGIVERLMSAGDFSDIEYGKIPSRAAMRYRKAFSKRDADRYVAYLESVKRGESKINAATLYPYEIVGKYLNGLRYDDTLELQWVALPNYADTDDVAVVMADVSGSMSGRPLEVSISLAIYFAERNKGAFRNYFMTFSGKPALVQVTGNTLHEKVFNVNRANWQMNTNIQAAFNLILKTAIDNNVPESDMPKTLFIVSDMEFDMASSQRTNFAEIKAKFARSGYTMPKLVFWNVDSRNNQTPVTEKEEGVYLVSGFSAGVFKAALQAKATNPADMMVETLNDVRYEAISEVLANVS